MTMLSIHLFKELRHRAAELGELRERFFRLDAANLDRLASLLNVRRSRVAILVMLVGLVSADRAESAKHDLQHAKYKMKAAEFNEDIS